MSRKKNLSLIILVALFIIPGVAAVTVYKSLGWFSLQTTNRGEFIKPPLLLTELKKNKKWHLLYYKRGSFDERCMGDIDKVVRIRLALGRMLYNVDLVLVLPSYAQSLSEEQEKILQDANVFVLKLPSTNRDYQYIFAGERGFYIVSPENHMILKYAADVASEDIFQDLKKLVRD